MRYFSDDPARNAPNTSPLTIDRLPDAAVRQRDAEIHIAMPGDPYRTAVESFITERFRAAFGAAIKTHHPALMYMRDDDGQIQAALGFRLAATHALFLENYFDHPIEVVLADKCGVHVPRHRIAEIGSLAAQGKCAALPLYSALNIHLAHAGIAFAVATATARLRRYFRIAGLETCELGAADPTRLADGGASWGRYYDTAPAVMAGCIPQPGAWHARSVPNSRRPARADTKGKLHLHV
jgi:hypothetical protein